MKKEKGAIYSVKLKQQKSADTNATSNSSNKLWALKIYRRSDA